MFYVKMDDLTLWSPIDNKLKIVSPTLKLEVNKIGSLSFKIYPDHVYYGRLEKMKSIISVHQGARTLFKGRVYSDNMDFHKVKKVEVEGLLGYFNDSRVRPYDFSGSVEAYFTMLVNQHNEQVEDFQKFKVGVVTVTDPNDLIVRASSNVPKTWDEINDKLIKLLGGYISIRYEDDGNYVDYLADYTDVSTQDIAFSVNLLDLNLDNKANSLSTCIIPYGAKDNATGEKIDITSVNDGLDYIYDEDAVARYGRIFEVVTWEDVTLPSNLLSKARLYLSEKVRLLSKLTVKAIDLHLTDETIEAFKLGDYVRVYSDPHGIDERVLLTAYSMDLTNPSGCTITLGLEKSSFLGDQMDANKEAINAANRVDLIRKDIGDMVTSAVNGLTIGGRNYLQKTDVVKYLDDWFPWGSTLDLAENGFLQVTPTEGASGIGAYPPKLATIEAGETYTVSFDAYAENDITMSYFYVMKDDNNKRLSNVVSITTTPKRYSFTFDATETYTNCSILLAYATATAEPCLLYLRNPKLEKGRTPTDWTPAPEDTATALEQNVIETQTYVNEFIENSEETTRTMLQEYAKTSDLESVREEMSTSITQTAADINIRFDTVDERITEENGEIVRILEENSKYIRLVDGNIILGEQGALLTTKIANGRISFLYNDTLEVAYISEQKLYITKAEILESIVIGNFAFIPRANGNLSFKKI